ncbi:MAG: ABC transporter ATP-binding protein [Sphaerochaetaceae bacterium]|nr:ABC transporter ATP-binding protein [Sphaerochaetaceae bacterium]
MAINTYKEDENVSNVSNGKTLLRTISYLKDYKLQTTISIIMILVNTLIVAFLPTLSRKAVDVDIANRDMRGLFITIGTAMALAITNCILSMSYRKILANVTNKIVYDIRKDTFDHLQTLSLYFFDSRPAGKILSRLINDVSSLKEMFSRLITTLIPNLVLIIAVVIIMLVSNPILSLSAFIVVPLLVASIYVVTVKGFQNWMNHRQKSSNMNAYTHESYAGIKVIQAFNAEKEAIEEGDRIMLDVEKSWVKAVKRADLLNVVVCWSQGIGYFILYLFAVKWLKLGQASVGQLIAFATYISLFWQPIRSLAAAFNQFTNQVTSAQRVFELLDTQSILQEVPDAKELKVTDGKVNFENINFAYPDEPDVEILNNLSFEVQPGQMIALVGPTGAGKTTIVNLLSRFYDPTAGLVKIDGQDISKVTLASLRSNIGVMTQDSFLFSGTIKENLVYGKPDATDQEIRNACHQLGLDDFIMSQPQGFDSNITQDSLSQGQKQLIALARTLIANPKVLLLDEATSAIDTRTEELVQKGMAILMKDRTSFVVAHRLSTIVKADCIMVIQNKGIAEKGTHKELLKANGIYAGLYKSQFEELDKE